MLTTPFRPCVALDHQTDYNFGIMIFQPSRALVAIMGLCCIALTTSSCRQRPSAPAVPALAPSTAQPPSMTLDQANTTAWTNAWTNLVNDVQQTFTPSLPKLVGVEVELVVGNPGPPDDTLTMVLLDASERSVAAVSKTVPTADCEHVLFVFPNGGAEVSAGQLYSLRLSGGTTFGWKYVVGGYEKGSASFNGKPLLRAARSTFLFRTFGTK